MTLLFADGFEDYAIADFGKYWNGNSVLAKSPTISAVGRRGGNCIWWGNIYGTDYWQHSFDSTQMASGYTIFAGFAFKYTGNMGQSDLFCFFSPDDSVGVAKLEIATSGRLNVYVHSSTTFGAIRYSSPPLAADTWYYIEFSCLVHATAGEVIGRLNGSQFGSYTGDTLPWGAANLWINRIEFNIGSYNDLFFDDIYICNDQGSYNNDFLGDVRIDAVRPDGAGNYTQMTPSAGNNYECVDEASLSTTDYVEADTDAEKDSYSFANAPIDLDDSNIYGIMIGSVAQRSEATDNVKIRSMIRTGSTDYYDGTGQSIGDAWTMAYGLWETDPSDSNVWTQAKINACEFGYELEKT